MSDDNISLGDLSNIRDALMLPKGVLFEQACQVARRACPTTSEEADALAQACLAGFKTKAEILGKVFPRPQRHSTLLQLTAGMCWFESWRALKEFAEHFSGLDPAQRNSSLQAVCLVSGCWTLTREDMSSPVVKMVLTYQENFLQNFVELEPEVLKEFQRRVMFKTASGTPRTSDEGFSVKEIQQALRFLGITPQRHILDMLHRVPVGRHDQRQQWPPLDSLMVSKLLDMPLANQDSDAGLGYRGWEHAVVEMLDFLKAFSGFSPETLRSAGAVEYGTSRKVLEAKATSPLTRLACRDALQARLKPLFNTSVLTALARKPRADGFYRESYSSNPETLAEELNEDYRRDRPWNPVVSQQLAFRQARGSHFMSVWRVRRHLEDEKDLRLYDIHAFLHDGNDQPIGRVALSLAISQKSPDTVQMARAFDTKDEPDLREIGLGLVREEKEGLLLGEDLGALLIVRSWEVHEASRRQGLGKLLLNEAARLGCRNLRTPTFATMRFQPYSQIEPLFDDWPAGYLPDLQEPYVELGMIAKHCVSPDTYLGKTVGHIYPAPYVWQCHAHPGVQLVALGALLAGAWN